MKHNEFSSKFDPINNEKKGYRFFYAIAEMSYGNPWKKMTLLNYQKSIHFDKEKKEEKLFNHAAGFAFVLNTLPLFFIFIFQA